MDAAALRHEMAAENLAHAHMPGYRRRIVQQSTFSTLLENQADKTEYGRHLGTTVRDLDDITVQLDFTRGNLKQTERNLDLALEGEDGFLVVNGPQGPLYTRNGSFVASPDGRLVTVDGLAVAGQNGDIDIPPGISSEAIEITPDGRLLNEGVEFDRLRTVRFDDPNGLVPIGASLFTAPNDVAPVPSEEVFLSGYVETANVAHMDELINIMVASRQYEAAQKALNAVDETLERRIEG